MGLNDRGYMNSKQQNNNTSFLDNPIAMIWLLIGINALVFILFPVNSKPWMNLVMTPDVLKSFQVYRILTAGFTHAGFGHILFNMWGLYIFGTLVTPHIGSYKFLALYITGVLTGNILFLIFHSNAVLLGASGAVCAIMAAAAMLEPNRRFTLLFFPTMPIKTSTLVVIYTIIEIISELTGLQAGFAHLAHLGGFLGGYLFIKILFRKKFIPWDPFRRKSKAFSDKKRPSWTFNNRAENINININSAETKVSSKELDFLLDKVSRDGINSLSKEEFARLKQARKEMRGEE